MASKLFGGSPKASSVKHFEIRTSWGYGTTYTKKDEQFFRHNWELVNPGKRTTETLLKGNYEWPFELILPGSTPETVEGLWDSWIIYRMKATIDRGLLAQKLIARKHVRVVRTLESDALELSHSMSIENTWANKINYTICTPSKAVIFGTSVKLDFRIAPLLKGLRISEVNSSISEAQDLIINQRRQAQKSRVVRKIAEDIWLFPEDIGTQLVNGQDAWLHAALPIHIFISPHLPLNDENNIVDRSSQSLVSDSYGNGAPPLYEDRHLDLLYSDLESGYVTPAGIASAVGTPLNSQSRRASADNLNSTDTIASNELAATTLSLRLRSINLAGHRQHFVPDTSRTLGPVEASLSSSMQGILPRQNSSASAHTLTSTDSAEPQIVEDELHREDLENSSLRRASDSDSLPSDSPTPRHLEFSPEELSKVPSYSTALQSHTRTALSDVPPCYQVATQPLPRPPDPGESLRT
ncbi:MAG: hypothetical protein Q9167_007349 [Letrouitia subvulpina]